ncbi:hypothetical protein EON67_02950 [archaeon]|nr:MAG: hypothetical protein EON67_02950 [archaeon]
MDIDAEVLEAQRSGVFSAPFLTLTALPPQVCSSSGSTTLTTPRPLSPPSPHPLRAMPWAWTGCHTLLQVFRVAGLVRLDVGYNMLASLPPELGMLTSYVPAQGARRARERARTHTARTCMHACTPWLWLHACTPWLWLWLWLQVGRVVGEQQPVDRAAA